MPRVRWRERDQKAISQQKSSSTIHLGDIGRESQSWPKVPFVLVKNVSNGKMLHVVDNSKCENDSLKKNRKNMGHLLQCVWPMATCQGFIAHVGNFTSIYSKVDSFLDDSPTFFSSQLLTFAGQFFF